MDNLARPKLVASKSNAPPRWASEDDKSVNNPLPAIFRHTLLTPDGTTIISSSVQPEARSSTLDSIVIPADLLDGSEHTLESYSSLALPEPIRAFATYPYFELSDPSTSLVLLSLPDHPTRLVNALALDAGVVASYPYIRPETEEFIAAHTLQFTRDANYFLAGADSEVSVFDINSPGHSSIQRYKLRHQNQFKARGQWHLKRSIVSAMEISSNDVLAVGTFGREIGLFDHSGQGDLITSFELGLEPRGAGISQVVWSDCGRYLLVGERKSDVIQVFDIRGEHRLLSTLVGRKANTMMKLKWDITATGDVWAGGTDGIIRGWKELGMAEGECTPSTSWKAHDDPVVSTLIHRSGSVAITASACDRNRERDAAFDSDNDTNELSHTDDVEACPALALWDLIPPKSVDESVRS